MRKIWPQNNTKLNFRFGYNAESNIIVAKENRIMVKIKNSFCNI